MTRVLNKRAVLAVGASVLMSLLGIVRFVFPLPVLVVALKGHDRQESKIMVVLTVVLVFLIDVFRLRSLFFVNGGGGLAVVEALTSMIPGIASIVWVMTREKRMLIRFAGSCAFGVFSLVVFSFWLSTADGAEATREILVNAVGQGLDSMSAVLSMGASTAQDMLPAGVSLEMMLQVVGLVFMALLVPAVMLWIGFIVFLAENLAWGRSPSWTARVAGWRLPQGFVWVFLGAFALVLGSRFITVPLVLLIAGMNIWMASCVLYMVQGFAILVHHVRARVPGAGVQGLFIRCVLFCLFPLLNTVVMLGLPLVGVLETWIEFRKNEQGVRK